MSNSDIDMPIAHDTPIVIDDWVANSLHLKALSAKDANTPAAAANSTSSASTLMVAQNNSAAFFPADSKPDGFNAKALSNDREVIDNFPILHEMLKNASDSFRSLLCRKTKLEIAVQKLQKCKTDNTVPPAMKYTVNLHLGKFATDAQNKRAIEIQRSADKAALDLVLEVRLAELAMIQNDHKNFISKHVNEATQIGKDLNSMTSAQFQQVLQSFSRALSHENTNIHLKYHSDLQKEKQKLREKELAQTAADDEVNSSPAESVNAIIDRKMKDVKSKMNAIVASQKNLQQPAAVQQPQPQQQAQRSQTGTNTQSRTNESEVNRPRNNQRVRQQISGWNHGRDVYTYSNRTHYARDQNRERLSPQSRFELHPQPHNNNNRDRVRPRSRSRSRNRSPQRPTATPAPRR